MTPPGCTHGTPRHSLRSLLRPLQFPPIAALAPPPCSSLFPASGPERAGLGGLREAWRFMEILRLARVVLSRELLTAGSDSRGGDRTGDCVMGRAPVRGPVALCPGSTPSRGAPGTAAGLPVGTRLRARNGFTS
ncbi:hypothetical protein P7K49_020159 [Saguinus oedipus]|uniref:Uncharacterized protein n=1 Tax=Saguinus oedipus TaxID=9490 RepID=A0ABQ9UZQ8_SAGOE|nr:hypothetical protein P7K49_020159 [Saguinus oedipus]